MGKGKGDYGVDDIQIRVPKSIIFFLQVISVAF